MKFSRNQKVYSEGQEASKVWIVRKGDFEIEAKLAKREDANELRIKKILGINKQKMGNVLAEKMPEMRDLPSTHKLSIYGPGCLLGEEDVLSKKKVYSCTVRCYSTKGVLYEVSKDEFLKLLLYEKTFEAIHSNIKHK